MVLPISISYKLEKPYAEQVGYSDLAINLTTGKVAGDISGKPFDKTGKVILAGEGVFQYGTLKGLHCRMFIEGML